MADTDLPLDSSQPDDPEERLAAFDSLGIPASQFAGLIEGALTFMTALADDGKAAPWVRIGPRNIAGAVRALAQDPANPSTLWAGTSRGGLWRTDDAGATWRPQGAIGQTFSVGALAFAGGTLYIGSGEPFLLYPPGVGLFKSTDGGATIERIVASSGADGAAPHYFRIVVDPAEPRRFWAASTTGLWRFEPQPDGSLTAALELAPPAPSERTPAFGITDVVVGKDDADPVNQLFILAGRSHEGIWRRVWDRRTPADATAPHDWALLAPSPPQSELPAPGKIGRVSLAVCRDSPEFVYALFEDEGAVVELAAVAPAVRPKGHPTEIYASGDRGRTFARRRRLYTPDPPPTDPPGKGEGIAWYALALAVHPTEHDRVIAGSTNLYTHGSGGGVTDWTQIIDWLKFRDDRASHADMHAILFDAVDPTRVWVGHDGGIAYTTKLEGAATKWRNRSYGLQTTELNDITVHPTLPTFTGGGMQDQGSWLCYAGPTWYQVGGGDGGAVAFDPNDPRILWTTDPGDGTAKIRGITRKAIGSVAAPFDEDFSQITRLPDLVDREPVTAHMIVGGHERTAWFPSSAAATFVGIIVHHPRKSLDVLVARRAAAFHSGDGETFTAIPTGPFTPPPPDPPPPDSKSPAAQATALAYGSADPDHEWWVGTSTGNVFRTRDAGATAIDVSPFDHNVSKPWVSAIAIHPTQPALVAISTGAVPGKPGQVWLSFDAGGNWFDLSAGLPPCPISALVFHPTDPTVLYAGTLVGVIVSRDLPAAAGGNPAPAVTWRRFTNNFPLVLVSDLAIVPVNNTLRASTRGRGAYECNLSTDAGETSLPGVRLSIRSHVMDDGVRYAPANTLDEEPRLPHATPAVPMNWLASIDIRVDAPPARPFDRFAFGDALDGAELDELMINDPPALGDPNTVYVQVHNRGTAEADGVSVHLYFASVPATAAVPPAAGAPPDLQSGFWDAFPAGDPPAGAWKRAAPPVSLANLAAGQPQVARFAWTPPPDAGDFVALLAVTTSGGDDLATGALPSQIDPLVRQERRAAARVMATFSNPLFLRSGVDDLGTRAAVAWGGRSPDILVLPPNVDDTPLALGDLDYTRPTDRFGADNRIFVRVFNRSGAPVDADVDVYEVPPATLAQPATWRRLNAANTMKVANVTPQGWTVSAPLAWQPTDAGASAYILVALVSKIDAAAPPASPPPPPPPGPAPSPGKPRFDGIDSVAAFWRLFRSDPGAERAAARAVRKADANP